MTVVAFHSAGTIALLEGLLTAPCTQPACGGVVQLSLSAPHLSHYSGHSFSRLFHDLASTGFICIGLYRQLRASSSHRYVITAPNPDLLLHHTDLVLALLSP